MLSKAIFFEVLLLKVSLLKIIGLLKIPRKILVYRIKQATLKPTLFASAYSFQQCMFVGCGKFLNHV